MTIWLSISNFSKIKTNLWIEWGEMGEVFMCSITASPFHFHPGTPKGGWRWCSWSQWSRMCETSEIWWPKMALPTHRDSRKINITMEIQPFEAASPITRWWFFQKAILVFGGWYLVQPFCLVKNTLQNVMFWGPSLVVLLPHENGIQVQARHFCCQKNLRRNRLESHLVRRYYHKVPHQSYVPNMTVWFTIHENKNDSTGWILRNIFYYLYILVLRM